MKIFFNNFPVDFTEKDLENLFAQYGDVHQVKIIYDQYNGYSRGFGFVIMKEIKDAEKALKQLSGKKIKNQRISLTTKHPKK